MILNSIYWPASVVANCCDFLLHDVNCVSVFFTVHLKIIVIMV